MKMTQDFWPNLSYEQYDQIDALRFSDLKWLERSPQAYIYHRDNKMPPTQPMIIGNAAHKAILEPTCTEFAVFTGPVRRGKIYDAWKEQNAHKTQLNIKEMVFVEGMRDAVHAHPIAHKYLRVGKVECSLVWRDPQFKRDFKARVDNWIEVMGDAVLVSLKSTVDCRDFRFGAQYAKMGYHCQDAIYQAGFFYLTGELPRMVTIAVESKPPHEIAVYRIPTDVIRLGQQTVFKWMEMLAECEKTNKWPGAVEGEQELALPAWASPDGDFDFDDLEPLEA